MRVFTGKGSKCMQLFSQRKNEILVRKEEENRKLRRLFEQTAVSLAGAIDATDPYGHGHCLRVAEYAKKLAGLLGKKEEECDEIYYAALLHDVGKIGIPKEIFSKSGRLTGEEYDQVKKHAALGAEILSGISEYPFISLAARHHHERYDGRGYPDGLKGDDIPEIARILAVADAYDAMTSRRSYRDPIPQQKVREEFVKNMGSQFDPEMARSMIHLIDMDSDYQMKEKDEVRELAGKSDLVVEEYRSAVSEGILLTPFMTTIRLSVKKGEKDPSQTPAAALLLFDSLDGRVHTDARNIRELLFFEYGEIGFDGKTHVLGARKMECRIEKTGYEKIKDEDQYIIEGLKLRDHVMIRIFGKKESITVITALPDSARFVYIGLTGEHCRITDVSVEKAKDRSEPDYIPRIAEEISYIKSPAGDIPNVQVDGYRTAATRGIPVADGMEITFHTKSLPTARLVWHCPFINIFTSDDGTVRGENYHDYTLIRLDGECWEGDPACAIELTVHKNEAFNGWEDWKRQNKEGFECRVQFERRGNTVTVRTQNAGISIRNVSRIQGNPPQIYAALTGDQCAITNIRITEEGKGNHVY